MVDPRIEADAQIHMALTIVCAADCSEGCDETPCHHGTRYYTPAELEDLFFSLSMAMVQLTKVPGGAEAKDRFYNGAKMELIRRGRRDLVPV